MVYPLARPPVSFPKPEPHSLAIQESGLSWSAWADLGLLDFALCGWVERLSVGALLSCLPALSSASVEGASLALRAALPHPLVPTVALAVVVGASL